MNATTWTKASPLRKRVILILAVLVVALVVTVIGSQSPIDEQQANQISDELNQTVTALKEQGGLTQYIFGNNFMICLLMFVPIIGPIAGMYIMFSTGSVVGAIATAGGYPSILALAALLITPVAWLEFAAYATAMAESIWLFRRLLQARGVSELKKACIFISICAAILVLAAVIEVALISFVP
jgi:uncharacterized membrane protein SpoIIM required for sporulation